MGIDDYREVISFPANLEEAELDSKDYWPGNIPPSVHQDAMEEFLKFLSPIVGALETAAFAIPEGGIFISAGIGFLWGAIQPGALHKYQEPMASILGNILESKLSSHELRQARDALEQFNGYFKDAVTFAIPQNDDDIQHSENLAVQFAKYVEPGGLLSAAFYTCKDNLPWFNSTDHMLLVSLLQSIVMAYKVQLMCWQAIAFRRRASDDFSGYNQAQIEVITLLARIPHLVDTFQQAVEQKITDLKDARVNGVSKQGDKRDRSLTQLTEHRRERPDPYYTAMWVHDPASDRNLLRAELVPTSTWGKISDVILVLNDTDLRPNGAQDDDHFNEILDVAMTRYKKDLLPKNMDKPWVGLREGIKKVVKEGKALAEQNSPAKLKNPPIFVTPENYVAVPDEALSRAHLSDGDLVSFRISLHSIKDGSQLCVSPWSPLDRVFRDGTLRQIYVDDGCAATNTSRQIHIRTSETDNNGILVGTIKGHGIMKWP